MTEEISSEDREILYEGDAPVMTDLTYAVICGDLGKVLDLLEKGADVSGDEDEALREAVRNRASTDIIGALLRAGADVNALDGGKTVLMLAAWRGYTEIVDMLLDAGADASIVDHRGHTAADLFSKKRSLQKSPALRRLREACGESAKNIADANPPDEG